MLTIEELSDLAAALRGSEPRGLDDAHVKRLLGGLLAEYSPECVNYHENNIWFRAVHCPDGEGFSKLSRCLYRPDGAAALGRANLKGSTVLYAAWNLMTALDEVHASVGDVVQLIGFNVQPTKNVICPNIGDIQRRHSSGRSLYDDPAGVNRVRKLQQEDLPRYERLLFVDSLLADLFRKSIDAPTSHLLTASFAAIFFRSGLPVLYPSVRTAHAMNIAIPRPVFDNKFQVLLTEVHRINKCYGYGIYDTTRLKQSTVFAPDGEIDWSRWNTLTTRSGTHGAPEPKPGTVGWRVL